MNCRTTAWITMSTLFFSSRRRHTRYPTRDWSSDVCSSDLLPLEDGWPVVAPTKRPYAPFGAIPGEPDEDAVVDGFVAAAAGARAEVLELDMAHGYLLGSYLSPLTNDEDDRLRFPLRVLEAVRAAWAGLLAVRPSVTDWHPRGNTAG